MNTPKNAFHTNFGKSLTPAETIISMFEHTDDNGTLYIPEWPSDSNYDGKEKFYQCVMDWNKSDAEKTVSGYQDLYYALETIAKEWESVSSDNVADTLPGDLQHVWNTYIRNFETGNIDAGLIKDISDRKETVSMVNGIADRINSGIKVSKEEMSFYNDNRNTAVSEGEENLYNSYKAAVHADAEHRIGAGIAAYNVIIRARRLCRLIALNAPKIVIDNEANLLAQAMVIHAFCKEMKTVEEA